MYKYCLLNIEFNMLKTVCLNMIVRNESKVIRRCLESVKEFIDYWVIVDTGSNDGTQKIIRDCMSDLPGDLYEKPWVDFAYNRNEAMRLAEGKGDFLLFIDADDRMVFSKKFVRPAFNKHSYLVDYYRKECITHRVLLIDNRLRWKWDGVVHEAIEGLESKTCEVIQGAYIQSSTEGFRSQDPNKFQKDIGLLKEVLEKDPSNSRMMFHLAVFSEDAVDYPNALKYFEKRATMGGWDQEVFYAMFRVAGIQEILGMDPAIFLENYRRAYQFRPSRAEPLFWMAMYYLKENDPVSAYNFASQAAKIPLPADSIYVVTKVYEYGALMLYSDSAFAIGKTKEALEASRKLLQNPKLPKELRENIERNLPFIRAKVSSESGKGSAPEKKFMP